MFGPNATAPRLALLFSDGSLNVYPENCTFEGVVEDQIDGNAYVPPQDQAKIVRLHIAAVEVVDDPTVEVTL